MLHGIWQITIISSICKNQRAPKPQSHTEEIVGCHTGLQELLQLFDRATHVVFIFHFVGMGNHCSFTFTEMLEIKIQHFF